MCDKKNLGGKDAPDISRERIDRVIQALRVGDGSPADPGRAAGSKGLDIFNLENLTPAQAGMIMPILAPLQAERSRRDKFQEDQARKRIANILYVTDENITWDSERARAEISRLVKEEQFVSAQNMWHAYTFTTAIMQNTLSWRYPNLSGENWRLIEGHIRNFLYDVLPAPYSTEDQQDITMSMLPGDLATVEGIVLEAFLDLTDIGINLSDYLLEEVCAGPQVTLGYDTGERCVVTVKSLMRTLNRTLSCIERNKPALFAEHIEKVGSALTRLREFSASGMDNAYERGRQRRLSAASSSSATQDTDDSDTSPAAPTPPAELRSLPPIESRTVRSPGIGSGV
jgi:hypothetical protein